MSIVSSTAVVTRPGGAATYDPVEVIRGAALEPMNRLSNRRTDVDAPLREEPDLYERVEVPGPGRTDRYGRAIQLHR